MPISKKVPWSPKETYDYLHSFSAAQSERAKNLRTEVVNNSFKRNF